MMESVDIFQRNLNQRSASVFLVAEEKEGKFPVSTSKELCTDISAMVPSPPKRKSRKEWIPIVNAYIHHHKIPRTIPSDLLSIIAKYLSVECICNVKG